MGGRPFARASARLDSMRAWSSARLLLVRLGGSQLLEPRGERLVRLRGNGGRLSQNTGRCVCPEMTTGLSG